MKWKAEIGTILMVMALIFMTLSLIMPWYRQESKVSASGISARSSVEYFFDHAEISGSVGSSYGYFGPTFSTSTSISYDNESIKDLNIFQTFRTTQVLAFVGLVGCIIGLLGATMVVFRKIGPKFGAFLVLIAVILSLIAPLYIMFALPAAYEKDLGDDPDIDPVSQKMTESFFGSEEYDFGSAHVEFSWGGSNGWLMAMCSMIICVVSLFLVILSKPQPSPLSREYSIPSVNYETRNFPTAHKEDGWSRFENHETEEVDSPLVFSPIGPKPKGGLLPRRFECPECQGIIRVSVPKRPLNVRCSKCGVGGIVE